MISLDPKSNISITTTTLGISTFNVFVAQQMEQSPCPCCFETHIKPDDGEDLFQDLDPVDSLLNEEPPTFTLQQQEQAVPRPPYPEADPTTQEELTDLPEHSPNVIEDESDPTNLNPTNELL